MLYRILLYQASTIAVCIQSDPTRLKRQIPSMSRPCSQFNSRSSRRGNWLQRLCGAKFIRPCIEPATRSKCSSYALLHNTLKGDDFSARHHIQHMLSRLLVEIHCIRARSVWYNTYPLIPHTTQPPLRPYQAVGILCPSNDRPGPRRNLFCRSSRV